MCMQLKAWTFYPLQELDLSNNYLDNLPAGLFKDMSNLTRLNLHNNSLTVMDRDLFQVCTGDYATLLFTKAKIKLFYKSLCQF